MAKALDYFNKSADIRKSLHDHLGLSSSLLNKGIVLRQMGNEREGVKYLVQSYQIREKIGSRHLLKEVLIELKNHD